MIDVVLPDTTGFNLLKSIPSKTKKIVMTGAVSEENKKRAQTEGADVYLLKPIKPNELLQIMAT